MSESYFDRERRIRGAKLTMGQTFYLSTINLFLGNNGSAWPTQETIAAAMNSTVRAVRKWQRQMQASAVIQVTAGRGRSQTNSYQLRLDSLPLKQELSSSFTDGKQEPSSSEMRNTVPLNAELSSSRKNKERSLKEYSALLPESLRESQEFAESWQEWISYRKEIRKKLTPATAARQLKRLTSWGPSKGVRAIQASIEAGWTGLFDPDGRRNGKAVNGSAEAAEAFQTVLAALREHSRFEPEKVHQAIGEAAWQALRSFGLKRLDESTDFERKALEAEFCRNFERQGAAA